MAQAFELRSGSILPRREVYDAYLAWCGDHNVEATAQSAFGKILHRYALILSLSLGRELFLFVRSLDIERPLDQSVCSCAV